MNQTLNNRQEWLKVLGKGMITLPKKWRVELGIDAGDIVKAKKIGSKLVIEPKQTNLAPYRVYSNDEIDEFVKEDRLPIDFVKKIQDNISSAK